MAQYYLQYARQHKEDWQALDGAQFEQIQRGWAAIAEGPFGLELQEQARMVIGYLNAMNDYFERRGFWRTTLALSLIHI